MSTTPATANYQAPEPTVPETVELYETLKPVCGCESVGNPNAEPQQYRNGEVLRGYIDNRDIGMCQINTYYWQDKADELGYDIFTEEGNIKMANYIYEVHGLQPWSASRECWKDNV